MAQSANTSRPTMKYVYPPEYRVAVIDMASVNSVVKPDGCLLNVHLSRLTTRITSEDYALDSNGNAMFGGPQAKFESDQYKTVELTGLMTPSSALGVVTAITAQLLILKEHGHASVISDKLEEAIRVFNNAVLSSSVDENS